MITLFLQAVITSLRRERTRMTQGKDLEGHFIWPFFGCQYIYIYIYIRRVRNIQLKTDSANAKVVVGQYYLPDVFSPLVLLARTTL